MNMTNQERNMKQLVEPRISNTDRINFENFCQISMKNTIHDPY